jgi:hypothetical protein
MATRKREERIPTQPELAITWSDEPPKTSDVRPKQKVTSAGPEPRASDPGGDRGSDPGQEPSLERDIVKHRLDSLVPEDAQDRRTTARPPRSKSKAPPAKASGRAAKKPAKIEIVEQVEYDRSKDWRTEE